MLAHASLLLQALALAAGAANPIPIFDGRLNLKPAAVSAADLGLLEKQVLPMTRGALGKDETCIRSFRARDVGTGSFTRAGASQTIILYEYCEGIPGAGWSGIAVFERGTLVANAVFDTTTEYAIGVLPDMDGDGRDEIVLGASHTSMGESDQAAILLGWSPGGLRPLGIFATFHDDCYSVKAGRTAERLWVVPGPTPTFVHQTFAGKCGSKSWTASGTPEAIKPGRDPREYRLLSASTPDAAP